MMMVFKRFIIVVIISIIRVRVLVGWERIRVISFILIIYLQRRRKSGRRGLNAIISNRARDAMFLLILYGRKGN